MAFIANFIKSAIRMLVGVCVLLFAASIPVYFVSVDKTVLVASGRDTASPEAVAKIYLDNAKLSTADMIAVSCADHSGVREEISKLFADHPRWLAAGGDEPFFDAFFSTLSIKVKEPIPLYNILSLSDNRQKLLHFLKQSQTNLVRKFIELRSLNSTILPPVYTSAGAPLDASLLTAALLAQSGEFNPNFQKDLSATLEKMNGDSAKKDEFEKFCLALLVFERNMDWTQLRSLIPHFDTLAQMYDFARLYKSAPDAECRDVLVSSLLLCGDADACNKYLNGADDRRWRDLKFAFLNGEGSIKFLFEKNKPVYKSSFVVNQLAPVCEPLRENMGEFVAHHYDLSLIIKITLLLVGGYLFIRGFLRLFKTRRDTPSWHSPLALARGFFEAIVVGVIVMSLIEPDAFNVKIENGETPELRFAFEKVINNIGEDSMKFETDSASLVAIGVFLVIQFAVYVVCLIRLASIKRTNVPAAVKIKLLENEDNLFDLGLYIGLTGTVASLILLSLGIFTASLMAGYTSTLFGIIFTAILKVVNLRAYKSKLLIESMKND